MKKSKSNRLTPLTIALIYASVATLWIYFSGRLLSSVVPTVAEFRYWQMVKGFFFVATTATLLYCLIRSHIKSLLVVQNQLESENAASKSAQLELQASAADYRAILAAADDGVIVHDIENYDIIDANSTACEMFGCDREEFRTRGLAILTAGDAPYSEAHAREWLREAALGHPQLMEWKGRHKDGTDVWLEVRLKRITLSGQERILTFVHDFAPRKHATDALRESEERYRSLVELSPEAIFIIDGGDIAFANRAAANLLASEAAGAITGKPFESFVHPDYRRIVRERQPQMLSANELPRSEAKFVRIDGGAVDVEISEAASFPFQGKTVSMVMARDITEKKNLERQLRQAQKMEAIGTLAGGIAHDFNNFLTAINGYCTILQRKLGGNEALAPYPEKILSVTEKAAALTKGLLAYSKKQPLNPQPVDVNEIVIKIDALLGRLIGEEIELVTAVTDAELTVMADSGQIEQVLMNLATNSRDAMSGRGTLVIGTKLVELTAHSSANPDGSQPGRYALITVLDTGEGMDEKTRERIFDPFFSTKEVGKGTGLGLAMAYGIIKQHNGYIEVFSEPGEGTVFKIYLPLTASATTATVEQTVPPQRGKGETILVIEDSKDVRQMFRETLEFYGYRVIEALDGEDGVAKYRAHAEEIDLLLIDVMMPRKHGRETYDEIKRLNGGIKAIFTSGYSSDLITRKGVLAEGLNYIAKPISPNRLLSQVRSLLDGKAGS
jgi:PAS domain S-box-containing protein